MKGGALHTLLHRQTLPVPLRHLYAQEVTVHTHFIEETSSMRFPSCDSCDLLRVSVGKLGSSWKTLRLGGGGVLGGFSLA